MKIFGEDMQTIVDHVNGLYFEEEPDYILVRTLFLSIAEKFPDTT